MYDNYDLFEMHEAENERWLASRPICDWCKEHIQDEDLYEIKGDKVCPNCIEDCRCSTDDYID